MRRISPVWTGLYEGWLSVEKSRQQLEPEWTRAIQVAEKRIHRRRLQAWSAKVASGLRRQQRLKILTPIVFVVLCSCALLSSLLPFGVLSWGLAIFLSLVTFGALLAQTAVVEKFEKNPPPGTVDGRKLLDITDKWWDNLKPPPLEIKVDADKGEMALLDGLGKRLSNQFILLHQHRGERNLDADVVVLGPNGIWLLESKYQGGKVLCRAGTWSQEKRYRGRGGIPKKETLSLEPFDEQWLRGKESVTQTILRRLPQEMHWLINEIRGGLVFTHSRVTLDIDPSCGVEYGSVADWVKKISTSPAVPTMTTDVLVRILDAVLGYASEISTEKSDKSAVQLAVDIYNRAEIEIPAFVKANL